MTSLELIERHVPKDKIAMLSIPMIPVKIIITIFLTRYLVGNKKNFPVKKRKYSQKPAFSQF